jgi:hypothetical protein
MRVRLSNSLMGLSISEVLFIFKGIQNLMGVVQEGYWVTALTTLSPLRYQVAEQHLSI